MLMPCSMFLGEAEAQWSLTVRGRLCASERRTRPHLLRIHALIDSDTGFAQASANSALSSATHLFYADDRYANAHHTEPGRPAITQCCLFSSPVAIVRLLRTAAASVIFRKPAQTSGV